MKNTTYKIYKKALSNKSSNSLFEHFIKVCSFFTPQDFYKKKFLGWEDKKLADLLIKIRKNKKLFSNIYKTLQISNELQKIIVNDNLHKIASDFLKIEGFDELNFFDDIWLKSIIKVCQNESLNRVVIFSDSKIDLSFISNLESHNIEVLLGDNEISNDISFLDLFINYLYSAQSVICNASTLVLSLSFMFHEKIYLPSKINDFQKVFLNNAHKYYPISLNWN